MEFCLKNKFHLDLDDDDFIPDLHDEWLSPEEFHQRRALDQIVDLNEENHKAPRQPWTRMRVPAAEKRADDDGNGHSSHPQSP